MKAIMYHYVQNSDKNLPFFRYLDFENFKKQLDFFEKNYSFLTYEEFLSFYENPPQNEKEYAPFKDKILLSFDDGLKCHYDFVFKELKRRGLFGFFFVCSGVYERKKALDVHRIHFLLGKLGGKKLLELANEKITLFQKQNDVCIIKDSEKTFFQNKTYLNQDNDVATSEFKKLFNYYIKYAYRETMLDSLMQEIYDDYELFENFYMSIEELGVLQKEKMIIGSHSHSHFVFSKLKEEEQKQELQKSFKFLDQTLGGGGALKIKTFCYPYGGAHTYTQTTKELLNLMGVKFSFDVNYKDISLEDILHNPQALPRYDCNLFEYGKASLG